MFLAFPSFIFLMEPGGKKKQGDSGGRELGLGNNVEKELKEKWKRTRGRAGDGGGNIGASVITWQDSGGRRGTGRNSLRKWVGRKKGKKIAARGWKKVIQAGQGIVFITNVSSSSMAQFPRAKEKGKWDPGSGRGLSAEINISYSGKWVSCPLTRTRSS